MRVSFDKYPIDVVLCMLWSFILLLRVVLNVEGVLWVILGLPCLFFIPGYLLLFTLFPRKKTDKGLGGVERIAISMGLSLVIVSFIGIGFNYTRWGLQHASLLTLSVLFFSVGTGVIAVYRWFRTDPDERFIVSLDFSWKKPSDKMEKTFTVTLAALIVITATLFVYTIVSPKSEESFTEFYLLGISHKTEGYPRNLSVGENTSVIIGIINHEHRTVNYTVEIWLINQSIFNETEGGNNVSHMWFVDKITTTLKHVNVEDEKEWEPQWEYNYSFTLNRRGLFKLVFLLFTSPTKSYIKGVDYRDQAEEILDSAYKELHLWVNVS